jgi:hypothetical protein
VTETKEKKNLAEYINSEQAYIEEAAFNTVNSVSYTPLGIKFYAISYKNTCCKYSFKKCVTAPSSSKNSKDR